MNPTLPVMSHATNPIAGVAGWFQAAVPHPTSKNAQTQIGVHFEEVAEMIAEIRGNDRVTQSMLTAALVALHGLALHLKDSKRQVIAIIEPARGRFLDALCDQAVTLTGAGHMLGMDIPGALSEVDSSNWSKFVDGKPIFDENQKISKGPNYRPPNLEPFIGSSGVLAG